MKSTLRRWGLVPLVMSVVVVIDQWTKDLVRTNLPMNGSWAPFPALEPYFNIVHWSNTGAAFGLLQGQSSLFVVIALVVIVAVFAYARYLPGRQLGGALLPRPAAWRRDRQQPDRPSAPGARHRFPALYPACEWQGVHVAGLECGGWLHRGWDDLLAILLLRAEQAQAARAPQRAEMSAVDGRNHR